MGYTSFLEDIINRVIGIVNRAGKFTAKIVFHVEGKTIIAELPLELLEKVS